MRVNSQTMLSQNITLAYDSLNLEVINRGGLRGLVDGRPKPVIMDTPEMIVALYPPEPTVIQIGGRRIGITLPKQSQDIGEVPLWEVALRCDKLVPKSTPVAYGFNYDLRVAVENGDTRKVMINLFVSNPQRIEDIFGGQLVSSRPNIDFRRGQTLYNLALEPVGEYSIDVHLNAHFEFEGIALPPVDGLEASFRKEFGYLLEVLPKLLDGGK